MTSIFQNGRKCFDYNLCPPVVHNLDFCGYAHVLESIQWNNYLDVKIRLIPVHLKIQDTQKLTWNDSHFGFQYGRHLKL